MSLWERGGKTLEGFGLRSSNLGLLSCRVPLRRYSARLGDTGKQRMGAWRCAAVDTHRVVRMPKVEPAHGE